MYNRPIAVAAVAFTLGAVTMLLGLAVFSVPGRYIESLRHENKLLREMVNLLEAERAEVKAIFDGKGEE